MEFILIVILSFFLLSYVYDCMKFSGQKKFVESMLLEIEWKIQREGESPELLFKRGVCHQLKQDFISAYSDYVGVRQLLDENDLSITFEDKLLANIQFTCKPLPWSDGKPKDLSHSCITYFLIKRIGEKRFVGLNP